MCVLVGLLVSLPGVTGCSSLSSNYWMEAQQDNGWIASPQPYGSLASFTEQGLAVELSAPYFGGSKQHSLGPCLFPFIPLGKLMPGPGLELRISVRLPEPRRIQIKPEDWTIRIRTRNMEGMFGEEIIQEAAPSMTYGTEGQGSLTDAKLMYQVYGHAVESFTVQGAIRVDNRRIELPVLEFEKEGTLHYVPYTTQFLNLL